MSGPARLVVGRIGRAHGLRGELSIVPVTNVEQRFAPGAELFVDGHPYTVVSARPLQERFVVRLAGVDDRDAAEALRNQVVEAEPIEDAPEGSFWVHELIGSEVRDRSGVEHGRVIAVEANPAHDLLVLEGGALVPMVFVVSFRDGVVVVDPPAGLFDL